MELKAQVMKFLAFVKLGSSGKGLGWGYERFEVQLPIETKNTKKKKNHDFFFFLAF